VPWGPGLGRGSGQPPPEAALPGSLAGREPRLRSGAGCGLARAPRGCAPRGGGRGGRGGGGSPSRPPLSVSQPETRGAEGGAHSSSPCTSRCHPTSIHAAIVHSCLPHPFNIYAPGHPAFRAHLVCAGGVLGSMGGADPGPSPPRCLTSLMRMVAQVGHRGEGMPTPPPAKLGLLREWLVPRDARKPCSLVSRFYLPQSLLFCSYLLFPSQGRDVRWRQERGESKGAH
jgi:hypothetical protein